MLLTRTRGGIAIFSNVRFQEKVRNKIRLQPILTILEEENSCQKLAERKRDVKNERVKRKGIENTVRQKEGEKNKERNKNRGNKFTCAQL